MNQRPTRYSFLTTWLVGVLLLCFSAFPILAENTESSAEQSTASPQQSDDRPEEPQKPEESRPAVQPELEKGTDAPPEIELPQSVDADVHEQVQALQASLKQRQAAVLESKEQLNYAESVLTRLQDEYKSFELRLEKAGLNLTANYADLLKQRLERLRRQSIAEDLIEGIESKLSTAREEQLRLEEFEAIAEPDGGARSQLLSRRSELLRKLHKAVTEHIDALNEYYSTVTALQDQVQDYQKLLQQRLFWLPSAVVVNAETAGGLYQSAQWFISQLSFEALSSAVSRSVSERGERTALVALLLIVLLIKRKTIANNLLANSRPIGNVGQDRMTFTLLALMNSFLLALPGVLVFSLAALVLMEGNAFFSALSKGFTAAAFIMFLLAFIRNVARKKGLGESHFHWNPSSLLVIRREIPLLMAFVVPVTIITTSTSSTPEGAQFDDSLGRLLFTLVSIALTVFAQRIMKAVRAYKSHGNFLLFLHVIAVSAPLVLAAASLIGYHYTALQLERNLFVSICWLAFSSLIYYLGLRALSVRERRLTLKVLTEQRAAERKIADEETSADNPLQVLDMPEMNLKDISQQSSSLLRIVVSALALSGLFILWADVFPALQLFNDITLWTIATDLQGGDPLPITLADALLALLVGAGTVLAAKNLPGTLEVMVLSRMNLEPGAGYAITTITTYILVIVGVVTCLAVIGVQWSKLQWLVAALGVGLGFGLQEIVANFVSGVILLFERPIRVGDMVTIGGVTGTVARIRIRATTLVDWDRKEQIIPNRTFVTQDLTNWTLSDSITRVTLRVGVAYGSDVNKVQEILAKVASTNERVVSDPAPEVFCVGLGDSSIDFEVWVFVKDLQDMMPLSHEIHASIASALTEADIEIPFPQRDIHVRTLPDVR